MSESTEDYRDDGQAAFEQDMVLRREREEEALLRVAAGKATRQDAELLADGLGLDILKRRAA